MVAQPVGDRAVGDLPVVVGQQRDPVGGGVGEDVAERGQREHEREPEDARRHPGSRPADGERGVRREQGERRHGLHPVVRMAERARDHGGHGECGPQDGRPQRPPPASRDHRADHGRRDQRDHHHGYVPGRVEHRGDAVARRLLLGDAGLEGHDGVPGVVPAGAKRPRGDQGEPPPLDTWNSFDRTKITKSSDRRAFTAVSTRA